MCVCKDGDTHVGAEDAEDVDIGIFIYFCKLAYFMPPPTNGCVGGVVFGLSVRECIHACVRPVSILSHEPVDRISPNFV